MSDDMSRLPQWRSMTDELRAQAYSPSSMLDGPIDPYLTQYADRSAAAYAAVQGIQTFEYGPKPSNSYDVALPQGAAGPVPCHIFIHGGYWQKLSKRESFFAADAITRAGWAFAAIDYTLTPHATVDEIVEECCSALRHVRTQAEGLGIDPERLLVSGSSAGAHLSAMSTARLAPHERPAALCLLSGVFELEPLVGTYINDLPGMDVAAAKHVSPALADLTGFPPTLIAWGDNETDEFKRQSRSFADLLSAAGAQVSEAEIAPRNHFDIVFDLVPDAPMGQQAMALIP